MFFKRIEGYHAEVSYKFAQCLDKDIVSFDTLKFKLTKELIAEEQGSRTRESYGLKRFLSPLMFRNTCFLV